MLEYPRWKYLLVAAVLLLALLFALPNFFGEVPAPAQRALHQELPRQRPPDGALCERARSAGSARRRQRAVSGDLHHRAVVRTAHPGAAAGAGPAAHAARSRP